MSKYQPTYNGENNVGRSPSNKASYSPGHWKSYLINDLPTNHNNSRIDKERHSQRGSNNPSTVSQLSY